MPISEAQLVQEIRKRFQDVQKDKRGDYEQGYYDALGELLEFIEETEDHADDK